MLRQHLVELVLRLGLRPWDVDRLRPVDVWEMWAAWRWRWSRDLEATMTAAIHGNAFAGTLDPIAVCRTFHDYLVDPRNDGGAE